MTNERQTTREHLRRDLRALSILESAQRVVAIGALVTIAVHAIFHSEDVVATISLSTTVVVALAFLGLAFRVRCGADLIRRDLWLLDAGGETSAQRAGHPYREALTVRLPEQCDPRIGPTTSPIRS